MDIVLFKEKLFKKALDEGFTKCELFYSSADSEDIKVYKGETEKYSVTNTGGFGFRGLYNGKMGYFFSEYISEEVIDTVIQNAMQNAELIETDDKEEIFSGSDKYEKVEHFNEALLNVSPEIKTRFALDMERFALEYDKRIIAVNSSIIDTVSGETYIANTSGLELSDKSNFALAYIDVIAEKDGEQIEKGEFKLAQSYDELNAKEIAEQAAKKALSALGASSVKSGEYDIIIQNEAFADILECFEGCFYGDNVRKGFSLLKDSIGKSIASETVTIADEPLLKGGFSSTPFDSEGVACYNKNVVENGELKLLLHNMTSAAAMGTTSTGNGFKASFKSTVGTNATNFYLKPGESDFTDLLAKLKDGLLITEVQGLHSGANKISGDFSLAAEGFLIKDGKIDRPVNQITVASNFYKILKSVKTVGTDLKFGISGVGSPSVHIEKVAVSGL